MEGEASGTAGQGAQEPVYLHLSTLPSLGLPRTVSAVQRTVPGTQFTWCPQLQAHFLPALQTQWKICLLPNVPAKAPELMESPSEGLPSTPEPVVGPEEPPLPSLAGLGHRPTTPRSSRLQARKEWVPQRNNRRWGPNHQRGSGNWVGRNY